MTLSTSSSARREPGGSIAEILLAYSTTKARCHIRRRTSNSRPGLLRDYGLSGTACGAGSGDGSRGIFSIVLLDCRGHSLRQELSLSEIFRLGLKRDARDVEAREARR